MKVTLKKSQNRFFYDLEKTRKGLGPFHVVMHLGFVYRPHWADDKSLRITKHLPNATDAIYAVRATGLVSFIVAKSVPWATVLFLLLLCHCGIVKALYNERKVMGLNPSLVSHSWGKVIPLPLYSVNNGSSESSEGTVHWSVLFANDCIYAH